MMNVIRSVQSAWTYLTESNTKKEESYRKNLIKQALDNNKFFKALQFDKEIEGETLIQVLNEIRTSITSSVLNKQTRKYEFADLLFSDEERIKTYNTIIDRVCIEQIINIKIEAELLYNKSLTKNQLNNVKQLLTNCLHELESRDLLHQIDIICPLISRVYRYIAILEDFVIGVQPMIGPIGLGYKQVNNDNGFSVEKYTIAAATRKLQGKYNIEMGLEAIGASTLYHEICDNIACIFSKEVGYEIVTEIINALVNSSTKHSIGEIYNDDEEIGLPCTIDYIPNFVITNDLGLDFLIHNEPSFKFIDDPLVNFPIVHTGTCLSNDKIVNVLVSNVGDLYNKENAIVLYGYKGTSLLDVGLIYHPYNLAMLSPVALDAVTFNPVVSILTRRDIATNNSNNYFNIIEFPYEEQL